MNAREAARRLKLNSGTVTRYIRAKRLKAQRSGARSWDITEADLNAFAAVQRKPGRRRTRPSRTPCWRHMSPAQRDQVLKLKRANVPQNEIARRVGVSESAISHHLRRAKDNARSSNAQAR